GYYARGRGGGRPRLHEEGDDRGGDRFRDAGHAIGGMQEVAVGSPSHSRLDQAEGRRRRELFEELVVRNSEAVPAGLERQTAALLVRRPDSRRQARAVIGRSVFVWITGPNEEPALGRSIGLIVERNDRAEVGADIRSATE